MGNLRCDICTGCGRCGEIQKKVDVVTCSQIDMPQCSLENSLNRRLVTIDIGTTTIAMQLYDTSGMVVDEYVCVNPQVLYGADVISRIQAAKDAAKAHHMKELVGDVLIKGYEKLKSRLSDEESLLSVLSGNTTMIYLLMGYDTNELGEAPFLASQLNFIHTEIAGAETVIMPGFSAFVGGDIMSGVFALDIDKRDDITLLIDLGTNGEMILGKRGKITGCSTAAGPAFEGGVNRGVWGSDMVRILAELRRLKLMDETGLLDDKYFDDGILIGNVRVTQSAIRAIQLAKAAIATGIYILMKNYGINYIDVDRVILAGGFGYYLDPACAAAIGLVPTELANVTAAGGNTALLGCLKLGAKIINEKKITTKLCKSIVVPDCKTEILNLAMKQDFGEKYIAAMNFPGIN